MDTSFTSPVWHDEYACKYPDQFTLLLLFVLTWYMWLANMWGT